MINPPRKFKDGDRVLVSTWSLKMIVTGATLTIGGWRYKLAFPKNDGTVNKARSIRESNEDKLRLDTSPLPTPKPTKANAKK